ncbi:PorV/PorQ family protein [Calditrichota bacterium GD2]
MKTIKTWLWLFFLSVLLYAGDLPTAFLQINPDATSMALGGTNEAYLNGGSDLFVNPALMVFHENRCVQFSNIIQWDLMQYFSFAATVPIYGQHAFGLGAIGVNVPDIQEYDENGNYLGNFDNYFYSVFFGYAYKFFPFTLGLSVKYVGSQFAAQLQSNNGSGFGFEIGVTYMPWHDLRVGANFKNSYEIKWNDSYHDYSPKQMGIAFDYHPEWIRKGFAHFLLGFKQMEQEPLKFNAGLEVFPIKDLAGVKFISFRAGVGNVNMELRDKLVTFDLLRTSEKFYSLGAGLLMNFGNSFHFELDYSYRILEVLDNQQVVSTKIWF